MSDLWAQDGGIYLGFRSGNLQGPPPYPLPAKPDFYAEDRHIMTIGPNGSGKSRRLLLPNIAMLKGWSIIVVDPKGELCAMTQHRKKNKIILNPYEVLGFKSDGHNPVAALDKHSVDFVDDAFAIAESIIRVEGRDPHWAASAQDLLCALIMYARLSQPDGGNLGYVRGLLGSKPESFAGLVREMVEFGKKRCVELMIKSARYTEITPDSREILSIISTALTQTRWLDSPPIKQELASDSVTDFGILKRQPTTVYLVLPARRLGSHSSWLRLMIASILQPLLKDTSKPKVPVLLILDEFPALARGGFPIIEDNMAMFRGYGIKLWTVFQDLSQARKLYGNGWESFAGNAGVLQSFAPQDVETAEYLSKRTGLGTLSLKSDTAGKQITPGRPANLSEGESISMQPIPVMLAQDLRNMDTGFSVYFSHTRKGVRPIYLPFRLDGLEDCYERDPAI